MIPKLKKKIYDILYSQWDKKQLKRLALIKNFKKVYVFDIDNTLTVSFLNAPIDHVHPIPRKGMIKYAQMKMATTDKVIFISARDYRLFDTTKTWLSTHNIYDTNKNDLFLVRSSLSKIGYLTVLAKNNNSVVFIDDLSYNYENGEIKYYTETLKALSELQIEHKGLDFIEAQ